MGHADSKELNHSVKGNDETSKDLEVEKMRCVCGGGGSWHLRGWEIPTGVEPTK